MFDNDETLPVLTRSVTTAGAIHALTGELPTLLHRRDGLTFQFSAAAESALKQYIRSKKMIDRMVESTA